MRRTGNNLFAALALIAAFFAAQPPTARAQAVVDRMVARVESDILLQSDIQELRRYQIFADGHSETDEQILDRLIDQWIVRNEANLALFPQPSQEEVDRSLERLKRSFSSPEEFEERKKQSGLTDADINRLMKSQLFLSNYLDSRFRPTIQIDDKAIQDFYQSRVVKRAQARGQQPPSLDTARDFIQEALLQRAINQEADKWLKESRNRVRVQVFLEKPQ